MFLVGLFRPFPKKCFSCKSIGTVSNAVDNRQVKPTVLLLGYPFSKDDQIFNLASLHSRLGHDVLSYTLPSPHFFTFDHKRIRDDAQKLLDQLKDMRSKDIVVHCLSNNGYIVYQHVLDLLYNTSGLDPDKPLIDIILRGPATDESNLRIRGAIFDSCPMACSFVPRSLVGRIGHLGLTRTLGKHYLAYDYLLHRLRSADRGSIDRTLLETFDVFLRMQKNWHMYFDVYEAPGAHALTYCKPFPQLYLFSEGDALAPVPFLDIVIEQQQGDHLVMWKDFGTSGHVQHFETFPEKYGEEVEKFLGFVEHNSR